MSKKTIAVHSQSFHADDSLAVYLLRQTTEFKDAKYLRTRDPEILLKCDAVCDVGGIYDHEKRLYDHHQPSFTLTFPGSTIPLSSCGVVYFHFGKEINTNILKKNGRSIGKHIDLLYKEMYKRFIKEVDAIDNGKSMYPPEADIEYIVRTGVSERIAMLNSIGTFDDAIQLIGQEYENALLKFFDCNIPAIEVAEDAFKNRFDIDESGQIIMNEYQCGITNIIKDLEKEEKCKEILYIVSSRCENEFGIRAINSVGFDLRKPLPFKGLRGEELSKACGIEGGIFVHKNGFIGAFNSKESAIKFAKLAVRY